MLSWEMPETQPAKCRKTTKKSEEIVEAVEFGAAFEKSPKGTCR